MSENKKNKCRTCLKTNTSLKLLNSKPKMLKINKTYMELLKYVTHIEIAVEDECNISQGICCKCCKRIRDSYMFIKQVQKCNAYFLVNTTADINTSSAKREAECYTPVKSIVYHVKGDDEKPVIKLENDQILESSTSQPKAENDTDTISSFGLNDNLDDLPLSVYAADTKFTDLEEHDASKPYANIHIKTEQKNDSEVFQPICVLTESTYAEDENTNTDNNDSSKLRSCGSNSDDDPLDREATDEEKHPVENDDDKMLPVKCDECDKIFANSILLNRHKKDTHVPDELKIQCPKCPVKFSRRYNMYAHMRSFHKTETVRAHQIQPRKLVKTDVCEHCNRSYSDKYKLMAHIKGKHGPESPPKKEKQPPKRYLCTLCGLTCSSQSNLDIHYRRHTGEKPFKCDFCGRAYARLYDVQVHRRIHTGETPFKCTICEKAFKRSNKLKIHMRTHTNERPYKCTQCEKAFKQSKDLNIHKRTHTGERPYKCAICHSTFTQSNSLKLHQTKTKHFEINSTGDELNTVINSAP